MFNPGEKPIELLRQSTPNIIMVYDAKQRVGITASRWDGSLYSHCRDTLDDIGRIPFIVEQSEVSRSLRGKGVGVELYVAAVEEAAKYNGALVASECVVLADRPVAGERGYTSRSAHRVWNSRRFAERVHVEGLVAWTDTAAKNPSRREAALRRRIANP